MKTRNYFVSLFLVLIYITACKQAPKSDTATTSEAQQVVPPPSGNEWPLDLAQSNLEWIGTKLSNYHTGSIIISSGSLFEQDGKVTGGKFAFDMTSINVTGPEGSNPEANAKLLNHLKSADFFDVEKFPVANFEITGIKEFNGAIMEKEDPRQATISKYKIANPSHTISGNLTMKEITKNIEFPAMITVDGSNISAIAKFNIDRTQWGIVYPGKPDDLIRKEIHLGISLKAVKQL